MTRGCGQMQGRGVLFGVGVVAALSTSVAWAQSEEDGGEPQEAAPIAGSVGAGVSDDVHSQVASFAVTKLKDSPAVVTVITAQEIRDTGARDLIDVLYTVPGFFIGVDVQGIVGPGFRGLWGYEGKILMLIDGKEMNEQLYSTIQLGNEFPTELIERIEVVRGPGSVIYGGNAELAVINVVTRGVQGATDVMVSGTYGQMTTGPFASSYGRRSLTLSGRYVFEGVPGLSAFASASVGQGQRSARTFTDLDGNSALMAGNSALDPAVIQVGVGFRDIQATFLYHRYGTSAISGFGSVTPADANGVQAPAEPAIFESYHADLVGTFRPTNRIEITPRFNFTYQRPWTTADPADAQFYDKSVTRFRGRLIGRWAPIDELQVTLGGDILFDRGSLNKSGLDDMGNQIGLQTQFVQRDGSLADSIAYQNYAAFVELFSDNPIINVALGARFEHNSYVGNSIVPRLVLLRSFGPINLKLLGSLAFRAPGFENINVGVNANCAPSPTTTDCVVISPERTTVGEFEGSVDITKYQRLSANVFYVGIGAPIVYQVNPDGSEGYQNLGKQGSAGLEVGYSIRGGWGRAKVNYAFYAPVNSENIDKYTVPGHPEAYLAAPAHKGSLVATFKPLKWFAISPTLVVLGPRYTLGAPDVDGNSPAVEVPTAVLANLFFRVEDVGVKGLSIGLGMYNIFGMNADYLQPYAGGHAPLPGLDREVMLKIGYLFEPEGD